MSVVQEICTTAAMAPMTARALSEDSETDPALAPFLALLQAELAARPAGVLVPLSGAVAARVEALAEEVGEVDPDAPIEGEGAL